MNLIIQSSNLISPSALATLQELSQSQHHERISSSVIRLYQAHQNQALLQYCEQESLDMAMVPSSLKLADLCLVVMDMDSTLITIECIDELADFAGIKPQVAAITEAAMRGELDFKQSLTQRVALLAGLDQEVLGRVYRERLEFSPGAKELTAALKAAGVVTVLVSGGFEFFAERVREQLNLDHAFSNRLEIENGKLTGRILGGIVDGEAKAARLREFRRPGQLTLAIGDGANDLKMMAEADFSVAWRAKPRVREKATWSLNQVGLDGVLNLFTA